jgi:hypothetical protein
VVCSPGGDLWDGVRGAGRGGGGAFGAVAGCGPCGVGDGVDCVGGDGVVGEERGGDVVAMVGDFVDGSLCVGGGEGALDVAPSLAQSAFLNQQILELFVEGTPDSRSDGLESLVETIRHPDETFSERMDSFHLRQVGQYDEPDGRVRE